MKNPFLVEEVKQDYRKAFDWQKQTLDNVEFTGTIQISVAPAPLVKQVEGALRKAHLNRGENDGRDDIL
jgi:hypothetical protein